MQLNPIIVREFRARWRGWRAFAIVLGYAALLALAVGVLYATSLRASDLHEVPVRRMAQIGHDMFLGLTAMQVFAWMLLAPALTATSIAGEREEGMLDLLQMSPLSPGRILWGKLMAALSFIFLMMLAPLPITALCFLMGGVSPNEFLIAALLQGMTAITGAIVGLFCSAWCRRASTALAIAFTIMGAWGISSAVAFALKTIWGFSGPFLFKDFLILVADFWWRTNPILAVFMSSSFGSTIYFVFSYEIPNWIVTVFFEGLLALVLLYSASRALRRPLQEPLEKEARQKPRRGSRDTELTPQLANAALSSSRSTPAPRQSTWWEASWAHALRFTNPVLHREVQRKLRIRKPPSRIRKLLKVSTGFGVLLYLWGLLHALSESYGNREIYFYLPAILFLVIVCVAAAAMSATAFPRERESHTWESLRLSLLTPRQIVMGKLLPPVFACWGATFAVFTLLSPTIARWWLPGGYVQWNDRGIAFSQFVASFLIFCGTIWCYSCLGLLVSWWCRRSWVSVTVTISSLIFVLMFIPIFVAMAAAGGGDWITQVFATWHPFLAMSSIAEYSWRQSPGRDIVELVVVYLMITIGAGYMFLGLLHREMLNSLRETTGWSVKMDQ